ncbi:Spo0B domain-containing protein [Nesterenkonia pannonica]|uniref:sensor histidine kinase n=1 Tax=Nesterenkonia pannonica TaxID=1548602 RepID=UPI00216472D6|nr:Spo0B domain-containing protein [Nesterenkonia pannonica]
MRVGEVDGGAVITLRDQTELTQLTGELDGARTVTRGLRAQRHEFANRIHTVAGMLELGAVERAKDYLTELSAATIRANAQVTERIGDLTLSALILAKSVQASEQERRSTYHH